MKTQSIELTCDKHTHARKQYMRGDVIKDMPEDSAKRLIDAGRAKATSRSTKDAAPQLGE